MEDDDKTCKEEVVEKEEEDTELLDGELKHVDHKLHAQDFDFDSKFVSRFAVCTFLVGCYWFYPDILVRTSFCGIWKINYNSDLVSPSMIITLNLKPSLK